MGKDISQKQKIAIKQLDFYWCGWEGLAAAQYAHDSDSAYQKFEELIANQIKSEVEE